MNEATKQRYYDILREELIPAMGCTEPIAISYCAARLRDVLGGMPERLTVACSGNIIKNVKSVVVPHTGGLKGIKAAAAAGIAAGRAEKVLEVIAEVTPEQQTAIRAYLERTDIRLEPMDNCDKLDILMTGVLQGHTARVRVSGNHENVSLVEKDGTALFRAGEHSPSGKAPRTDRSVLTIEGIVEFADEADLDRVAPLLERQIAYNTAIAAEGLANSWGANVGSVLLAGSDDIRTRMRANAAAGSDARMSGCELPVVINSGSGNQGITVSVPVAVYSEHIGAGHDALLRALLVSNLIAIHIKTGIGPLSAYCGAVSAGCAAGCAIAYLDGGKAHAIAHTLVNAIAIVSGIVCDGAKPSCAAKIASALDAAFLGYDMYRHGQQFYGGDGIVSKGVENTIANIGRLGADGMLETDREILRIMTE